MLVKLLEMTRDHVSLPLCAIIERNILGVVDQIRLLSTIFSFQVLLNRCQFAKSGRYVPDNHRRHEVPPDSGGWSLPPHQLGQFAGEQNNVKQRLGEAGVDVA